MDFCAANGRIQPGFRFHPTNVELVMYYLKRKILRKSLMQDMVNEVDVYKFHPKDLRELASMKKDLNWYFFCPRGKKYGSGERTNRATESGYWKATGNDRVVSYEERTVGKIKTLVFHEGKPPKGTRTDWVMHEYKLDDNKLADAGVGQDSYVLCKVFEKSGWGPKNAEQYGAPFIEEEWEDEDEVLAALELVQHIGDHNQTSDTINSAISNVVSFIDNYPAATSEQVYSGATPTSIANAAEIPSNFAVDQMLTTPFMEEEWEDEDEVLAGLDLVQHIGYHNQTSDVINSAGSNVVSFIDNYPAATSEQVYSGATPTSIANAADIPSDFAVHQMLNPMSAAVNFASYSMNPIPEYNALAVQASTGTADIGSTSAALAPTIEEDEMDRLLDIFVVGDEAKVFEGLGDLDDNMTFNGIESCWTNLDNGGFYLSDLDEPL